MPFIPNRAGMRQLERGPVVTAHLRKVAKVGAAQMEQAAPPWIKERGAEFTGEAEHGEGRIVVKSPFWHIPEFGTSQQQPNHYIRPTFARYMAAIGGRLTTGRSDG